MADQKVTTMVLKVDLQCPSCYKKVRKILAKFPQIRSQVYDEKQNTVTITVVCCSPEKFRDKLCCKGGKTIKTIEILEPPKPKPPEKKEPEKTKPPAVRPPLDQPPPLDPPPRPAPKPSEPAPKPPPPVGTPAVRPPLDQPPPLDPPPRPAPKPSEPAPKPPPPVGTPAVRPPLDQPPPLDPPPRPAPAPKPPEPAPPVCVPAYPMYPVPVCCGQCYEGIPGGPCYQGYGRPVPSYDGYGYGGSRACYASRCDEYFSEENATGCTIM